MIKRKSLFQLYEGNNRASNLSIAGGGVRMLSVLFLVIAILYTLALLIPGFRIASAGGVGTALLFIIDELSGMVIGVFLLWAVFAACRYTARVLQAKAELLAPAQTIEQATVSAPDNTPGQQEEESPADEKTDEENP